MRIFAKTGYIAFVTCVYFLFASFKHKRKLIQNWIVDYLQLLSVEVEMENAEILPDQPFLFLANHVSWLDYFALQALKPSRVVAKIEVKHLPLVGSLATIAGIVFTNRNNKLSVKKTIQELAIILKSDCVCMFPEGTTHLSSEVLPFKSSLLEFCIDYRCTCISTCY